MYEDAESRLARLVSCEREEWSRDDAVTWLSAALAAHNACLDGLGDMRVSFEAHNLTEVIREALGLYRAETANPMGKRKGVSGDGFWARDMTFENTARPGKHQAVALRVGSDRSVFYRCSFKGYQDTLYTLSLRQFYRSCHVYGTVDFIFGDAVAVLEDCDILVRRPMDHQSNFITAHRDLGRRLPRAGGAGSPRRGGEVRDLSGAPWKKFSTKSWRLNAENVPKDLIEKAQVRVIEASLTLIRERAKLKLEFIAFLSMFLVGYFYLVIRYLEGELLQALGGVAASASLLGVPLGHNSSFLQGPAFAPPRIREAIWCGSTNSTTEEGKDLNDPRVLTDVGDVPVQELRDCGVDDDRLMNIISESVKLVMEEDPLRPLVLGGDHSISFPSVRAVSEKLGGPVDILHLDAHPDIYDAFEGNKYSHASSFARIMEGGYARRLLQVGIRSITKEGREQGKHFAIVYISVDLDCMDPAFAPGVSHIEPGGLSFRDVLNILQNLKGDVVAADVVEFNPQRDTVDGMTAMVAAKLVRELTARISK
ncbi:hypothetical protein SASPL_135496 [Salvia splendens]|uniref:Pectinesterase n=1 Tax=Salvia splendens TaxID=180675 RepID=A0A8X8WYZ2_SALSN|nr:hypothetical protein SASPL_135496 [Salvia splendens]